MPDAFPGFLRKYSSGPKPKVCKRDVTISLTSPKGLCQVHKVRWYGFSPFKRLAELSLIDRLSGPIRISAPIDLGRNFVSRAIESFTATHSAISVELSLYDGYADIVQEGFDISLRFGMVADSTLRSRRLGEFRRIVCASPTYLELLGYPKIPRIFRAIIAW